MKDADDLKVIDIRNGIKKGTGKVSLPPFTEEHFFSPAEWEEAAKSFLDASEGIKQVIYQNAEREKKGAGREAVLAFSKHLVMAVTALTVVGDNFSDKIGILIQKVPAGEVSPIVQ